MSGFHPAYIPIRVIDPGIRGYTGSGAAVPSSWQLFNTSVTPGDVSVDDAADGSGTPVGVNVFRVSAGAAIAASGYFEDVFIQNGVIPHRASAIIRSALGDTAGEAGRAALSLIYNGRFGSDPNYGVPTIGLDINCVYPGGISNNHIRLFTIESNGNSKTQTIFKNLADNMYYRVGIEVLGTMVNYYWVSNATANPDFLPGDSDLELLSTLKLTNPKGMEGPTAFLGFHLSGALGITDWSGYGDAILEELEGPNGSGGPFQNPPSGGGGTLAPGVPANFSPYSLNFPNMPDSWPYTQLKAVRELQKIYNNLALLG